MAETLPEPASRKEQYLAKIAGDETVVLPEPASRKEAYLATIAGMTGVALPEKPANREEEYLAVIAENGGGGGGGGDTGDYGKITVGKVTSIDLIYSSGPTATLPTGDNKIKFYNWLVSIGAIHSVNDSSIGTYPMIGLIGDNTKIPYGEYWVLNCADGSEYRVTKTYLAQEFGLNITGVTVPSLQNVYALYINFRNPVFAEGETTEYAITKKSTYDRMGQALQFGTSAPNVPQFKALQLDDGTFIDRTTILSYSFGKDCTYIPDCFLSGCSALDCSLTIPSGIKEIGDCFLCYAGKFNHDIDLNEVETVGQEFMRYCPKFNSNVTANHLKEVKPFFLSNLAVFNKPLNFPSLETIQRYFIYNDAKFNSQISVPNLVNIDPAYFMYGCKVFAQPLVINATNFFTGAGDRKGYFMYDCQAFTGPLTITTNFPSWMTGATDTNNCLATISTTVPMYTTGVTLKGAGRTSWITTLPDRTSSPYRKLIDGGE